MQLSRTLSCVALAALISACGEVKGTGTDGGGSGSGGDFTLSVDQSALTVPIAGSGSVTVTVERTGTLGDIMLSVDGLGSNLMASVTPNPIASGSTTAQVTISAVGGMLPAMSTVTITGTAGDKTHSATVAITTTTIMVTGTVRGGRSGIKVGIIGKQSVTSGAGGVFTFTDVTPPYDLYTFGPAGCGSGSTPTVYYFDDLTRPDPIVTAATYNATCGGFIACFFPGPSSSVSGTKTGAGNNTDPVVFAYSSGNFGNGVLNTNGTFSGTASWCSGTTSSGNVHAIQLTRKANGAPNTFLGYARTAATYTNGQAATTNLTFSAIGSSATITGTLNGPAGLPTPTVQLVQQFGTTQESLWTAQTTTIDASFPLIAAAGGNALYASTMMSGVGTSSFVQPLTGTATVNFTMPAPPVQTMPANAATGVTTTTMFAWTASTGVISQVFIGGSGAAYWIFTTKMSTTIPVIPELALPGGTAMNWSIVSYAPTTSIDDAAVANELEGVTNADYGGPAHAVAYSVSRPFTTQ
jgi:hypothetical protein